MTDKPLHVQAREAADCYPFQGDTPIGNLLRKLAQAVEPVATDEEVEAIKSKMAEWDVLMIQLMPDGGWENCGNRFQHTVSALPELHRAYDFCAALLPKLDALKAQLKRRDKVVDHD